MSRDATSLPNSHGPGGRFRVDYAGTWVGITCKDCGWTTETKRTQRGAKDARRATMAHAVEFHNCTYKADPKHA